MMINKKIMALIMATSILGCLSGCKNNDDIEVTSQTTTDTEITTVSAEKLETSAPYVGEDTSNLIIWEEIADNELIEHTENVDDVAKDAQTLYTYLAEGGSAFSECYVLNWETEIVSDGVSDVPDKGIVEIFHLEGNLDLSLPFTDMLNQLDEGQQIMTMKAISQSFKKSYGVDIVNITCDGETITTNVMNFDTAEETVATSATEIVAGDSTAAYEEE